MNKNLQRIQFANDLQELTYIINEFIEIARLLEDSKEVMKLVTALDRFYYAYESRITEVSELLGKIEEARLKHYKVIAQRDEYYKRYKYYEGLWKKYQDSEEFFK